MAQTSKLAQRLIQKKQLYSMQKKPQILKLLIDNGADPDHRESMNRTLLFSMLKKDDKEMVSVLIEKGANIDAKDGLGNTALLYGANFGRLQIIDVLLRHGADVNLANESLHTPLIIAAGRGGSVEAVQRILQSSPHNIDTQDCAGNTALLAACYSDSGLQIAKALLDAGADPYVMNMSGNTAFAIAAKYYATKIVWVLRDRY